MSQDQDSNLVKLRELNHNKTVEIQHEIPNKIPQQTVQTVSAPSPPSHHEHQHGQSCAVHGHQHGGGHGHRSHHGHSHGTPGKKNYAIIFYTIFTCLSCLYLQTQHLNPYLADSKANIMSYLAFFDVFMCLWSYIQTMRISSSVEKLKNKDNRPYTNLPIKNCQKCQFIKVPRVSHCSTCGKCIYKLDHHCIWTQTCIGYRNQRPFYLFTLYMAIGVFQFWYSTIRVGSSLSASCHFFAVFQPGVYILWLITCISAGVVGFMIVMLWFSHTIMVSTNFTTLDSIKTKTTCPIPLCECRRGFMNPLNRNNWDRGEVKNLKSLFGSNILSCWLPFGRQIQNEFIFQAMNPWNITDQTLNPNINISPENIKKKLIGKKVKLNNQIILFDEIK